MTDWFKTISEPVKVASCDGCTPAQLDLLVTAPVTDPILEIPDFLRRNPDGAFTHPDVPAPPYSPPDGYVFADINAPAPTANERDLEMIEKLRYHSETSERIATQDRIAKLKAKKAPHV
jgi:hypothetical protein